LSEDYFRRVEMLLAAASSVHSTRITYDKRSASIGFLRGVVCFLDSSQLHLREFVNVGMVLSATCMLITTNGQTVP
jgi:hypothetical protein